MHLQITLSRKEAPEDRGSAQGKFRGGRDSFWLGEIWAGFMEEVANALQDL